MSIKLRPAKLEDIEKILQMQKEAFNELLKKYEDYDTSPATENYDDIIFRFNQTETTYYFIETDGIDVGVIRIVDFKDSKRKKRISPIFITTKYRGRKYAQQAILEAERIHGKSYWQLETVLQEPGNCYLYEKMGYKRTGKVQVINDKLTLVFYGKE